MTTQELMPLIMMMGMGGGRGGNNILPLMLMMTMNGGTSSIFGSTTNLIAPLSMNLNPQAMMLWGLMPRMGTMASIMTGGVSALLGQQLMKPKRRSRRRRTRIIYRNRWRSYRR